MLVQAQPGPSESIFRTRASQGAAGDFEIGVRKEVPVFVPAFSDSELGLDFALNNRERDKQGKARSSVSTRSKTWSTLRRRCLRRSGWGFSRLAEACRVTGRSSSARSSSCGIGRGGEDLPLKRYHYGLRICPEPVYWGGLSGSPYSEAVSWGKFVPPAEGGKFGEVFVDATVGCR